MKLTNQQLLIIINGVLPQADDVPDIEMDMLLEKLQEMLIKRRMPTELLLVQDALKRRKRPAFENPVPLLLRD